MKEYIRNLRIHVNSNGKFKFFYEFKFFLQKLYLQNLPKNPTYPKIVPIKPTKKPNLPKKTPPKQKNISNSKLLHQLKIALKKIDNSPW